MCFLPLDTVLKDLKFLFTRNHSFFFLPESRWQAFPFVETEKNNETVNSVESQMTVKNAYHWFGLNFD